jgi:hypothetical protein
LVGGGWDRKEQVYPKKSTIFFGTGTPFFFSERKKEQKRKEQVVRKVGKKGN